MAPSLEDVKSKVLRRMDLNLTRGVILKSRRAKIEIFLYFVPRVHWALFYVKINSTFINRTLQYKRT